MTPEPTPRDNVAEAIRLYHAKADLDDHGVGHIYLTFPNLYFASFWVNNLQLERNVRLLGVDLDNMFRFDMEVKVIYEF
jgi:hypothetical protein